MVVLVALEGQEELVVLAEQEDQAAKEEQEDQAELEVVREDPVGQAAGSEEPAAAKEVKEECLGT